MTDAPPSSLGAEFAAAFAAKDFERMGSLLHPEVDFRALTPNRTWQASGAAEVVSSVLTEWLTDSDHPEELIDVQTGRFSDREQASWQVRGHDDKGAFVVEQQAYFTERDGRIDWMRVLCSGFRPPPG